MPNLTQQRCLNHAEREAVARCPECAQYFCRECVTEHDERVLCAACLRRLARQPLTQGRGFAGVIRFIQCLLGLLLAWFFFYLVGESLLAVPDSFHEGTLWQSQWLDNP
ncbi:MAG TPA: rhomboid family protein [Verrucomicrobiae bacterium]|nr:rhomboid family protein [Verrucomicrobiae bacterium]